MDSISQPIQQISTKINTPQILQKGLYAVWGVSFLLLILSIFGVISQRQTIKTIGKDAAPSILAAQQIRDSFADIDASLANELLLDPVKDTKALEQVAKDFRKNQKKIADRTVAAAKNITYPAEERIVRALQLKGSDYFLKLQEARDAQKIGSKDKALVAYRDAAELVDAKLTRSRFSSESILLSNETKEEVDRLNKGGISALAEELDRVNFLELDNAYSQQNFYNGGMTLLIAVVGLSQIGMLILLQLFIYQRMRRMLNLPLLAASAIAILFLSHTIFSLVSANNNLKVAKKDAFNSIHSLRQARALSYMANADESRYLLDRVNSTEHERAFKEKIARIITLPQGKSLRDVINTIPPAKENLNFQLAGFSGFYAEELSNITFEGERDGAVATLNKLDEYLKIDAEIRRLYRSGKIAEAIALCTGKSNVVFEEYKVANQKVREINQKAFDDRINAGFDNLDSFGLMGYKSVIGDTKDTESNGNRLPIGSFEIIACLSIASIATLTLFGLRPRLAEYL